MFVFDVISPPFSVPTGDVSDDDDAVTDVILFSCIFLLVRRNFTQDEDSFGGWMGGGHNNKNL